MLYSRHRTSTQHSSTLLYTTLLYTTLLYSTLLSSALLCSALLSIHIYVHHLTKKVAALLSAVDFTTQIVKLE